MDPCHLCGEFKLLLLIDFGKHPIAHRFLDDPNQEEYLHNVVILFCENCGLIQLGNPIPPEKLYSKYNWLSSWKWNPHIPRLVKLIDRLCSDLNEQSKIVEVGSNDGSFLEELRNQGYKNLLGVEPAQDAWKASNKKEIEAIGSYFTLNKSREIMETHGRCDLLVSRQMLEHITDLIDFQNAIGTILKPGGYVLLEVPNFTLGLDAPDYSAIWEEHVNYFTPQTLNRFLMNTGIRPIHSETVTFSGESLIVLGKYLGKSISIADGKGILKALRSSSLKFRDQWPKFKDALIDYLHKHRRKGGKVALYGAGCRANSLINFANLSPYIEFIVDDQPEKQNKYMPGSRLPILPSSALIEESIDLCLLAVNAENEDKVIAKLRKYKNHGGQFISVHPPSNLLPDFWHLI